MKLLEETIKQKCNFLGNSVIPYELYNLRHYSYPTEVLLYLSNSNIESENIITLLEEMTPLIVYIFSCIILHGMTMKLNFPDSELIFEDRIDLSCYLFRSPIDAIKDNIEGIKSTGHYTTFIEPFRLELILSVDPGTNFVLSSSEDEDEKISINDLKTFKSNECVICLEKESNILFCNCGYICICNICIEVKKLSKCPICKTENTILRIIE